MLRYERQVACPGSRLFLDDARIGLDLLEAGIIVCPVGTFCAESPWVAFPAGWYFPCPVSSS